MRVLIICGHPETSKSLEMMLTHEGFNCYATDLAEEGVELAEMYDYNAIILDPDNLDDTDRPLDPLKSIKGEKIKAPVLVLSGENSTEFSLAAFGEGADDFVKKPFHKKDLSARLQAIIRRSMGHTANTIETGEIAVNLDAKQVHVSGTSVHLTGKEYQMLELLSLRKGMTVTKEMFLNHLYGGMDEPELKIIDVFICKLRAKLREANHGVHHIDTNWGRGYILTDEPIAMKAGVSNKRAESYAVNDDSQLDAMAAELEKIRAAIGANEGDDIDAVLSKLSAFKKSTEKRLEDAPELSDSFEDGANDNTHSEDANTQHTAQYDEKGIRLPVGAVFPIGSVIEVDTNELTAGNVLDGSSVKITNPVGAVLEILTHFQGKNLSRDALARAVFEYEDPSNTIKLGQIMTQAQGALTQLVGRELAATLIQFSSGGTYGMPQGLTAIGGVNKAAALPNPKV